LSHLNFAWHARQQEFGRCRDAGALQHPDLALLRAYLSAQALDLVAQPVELWVGGSAEFGVATPVTAR